MINPIPLINKTEFSLIESKPGIGFYEIVHTDDMLKQYFFTTPMNHDGVRFEFFIERRKDEETRFWVDINKRPGDHPSFLKINRAEFVDKFIANSNHPATPWLLFNLDLINGD